MASNNTYEFTFQRMSEFKRNSGKIGYKKIKASSVGAAVHKFWDFAHSGKSCVRMVDMKEVGGKVSV